MNALLTKVKGWASRTKADVVWGFQHPKTVRKAIVAAATHAATMVAVFTILFPHTSTLHEATITAITTILTGTVTFLTSNGVVSRTGGA